MPEWQAEYATAFGTLFLGFAAILSTIWPRLLAFLRRPTLDVLVVDRLNLARSAEAVEFNESYNRVMPVPVYFVHLLVGNCGRTPAERVEVVATRIRWMPPGTTGEFQWREFPGPMNLQWGFTQAAVMDQIPPDAERLLSMARSWHLPHFEKTQSASGEVHEKTVWGIEASPVVLNLVSQPQSGEHMLWPAEYEVDFEVTAANARPITRMLKLCFDGKWDDDPAKMGRAHRVVALGDGPKC